MSGGDNREWWRGSVFDRRTVRMLEEAEKLAGVRIDPSQGSYQGGAVAASAGTHDGGGAVDVKTRHLPRTSADRIVLAMRTVGFAAWYRSRSQGFSVDHIHGIAVACPDLSAGARDQVAQYLAGRNGLRGRGPDDGPRDFPGGPGTTWEQYLARQQQQEPDEEEDGMGWLVARKKSSGEAWLLYGSGTRYGVYTGDLLTQAKEQGIPRLELDDKTFNALMKDRKTHQG